MSEPDATESIIVIESRHAKPLDDHSHYRVAVRASTRDAVMSGDALTRAESEAAENGFDASRPDPGAARRTTSGFTRVFRFYQRDE